MSAFVALATCRVLADWAMGYWITKDKDGGRLRRLKKHGTWPARRAITTLAALPVFTAPLDLSPNLYILAALRYIGQLS